MLHILKTRMRNSTKKYFLTGSTEYNLPAKSCQTIATPFYSLSKPHYRWYHEKIKISKVWDTTDTEQEQGKSNLDVPHTAPPRHVFHPPGSHAWTDLDVSVFVYSLYKFDDMSGMVNTSKQSLFRNFWRNFQHSWKKTYATGTCLCLEDDSYNSDPTSQFSRLNTYYLGLAQCYLSNSRHSVCSSTGPQKEGYYVIIISLKQPHA